MKNVVTDPEKVTRILKTATEIFGQQGFDCQPSTSI